MMMVISRRLNVKSSSGSVGSSRWRLSRHS